VQGASASGVELYLEGERGVVGGLKVDDDDGSVAMAGITAVADGRSGRQVPRFT
jgi:hypothetical protein